MSWKAIDKSFDSFFTECSNKIKRGIETKEENYKLTEIKIEGKKKKITDNVQKAFQNMKKAERAYNRAKDRFYGSL